MASSSSQQVFGRVVVPGITDQTIYANDPHPHVTGGVCWGPDGSMPGSAGWTCVSASLNAGYSISSPGASPSEDEWEGTIPSGISAAGSPYDYAFRFQTTGGPAVYCDTDLTFDGYQPAQAGQMTITP